MNFRVLPIVLLLVVAVPFLLPASSKPKAMKKKVLKSLSVAKPVVPFLSASERLPITQNVTDEGDVRNDEWQNVARLLQVRDLRVYDWPSAYNKAGVAEEQQGRTLHELGAAGYRVEKFNWDLSSWDKTTEFEAHRGNEVLSAMWRNNGSHLFLYCGHQVPQTPFDKRNDDLIEAVISGQEPKVQEVLKQGADPRALDYSGDSVLSLAASGGKPGIVKQLLAARKAASKGLASEADLAATPIIRLSAL